MWQWRSSETTMLCRKQGCCTAMTSHRPCPAFWALSVLLLGSQGCSAQESNTQIRFVGTAQALQQAATDGVKHIVLTEHIDLSAGGGELSDRESANAAALVPSSTTHSITVRRDQPIPRVELNSLETLPHIQHECLMSVSDFGGILGIVIECCSICTSHGRLLSSCVRITGSDRSARAGQITGRPMKATSTTSHGLCCRECAQEVQPTLPQQHFWGMVLVPSLLTRDSCMSPAHLDPASCG